MTTKFLLTEAELPDRWHNILPDLTPLFPLAIIGREVPAERWIEIQDRVRDVCTLWRPTPLYRA